MSLLNAWVTPAEAIVAADTHAVAVDGSGRAFSKVLPIPHLNAVLANRGQGMFLNFVWARCLTAQSFDEMLDDLSVSTLSDLERNLIDGGFTVGRAEDIGHELIAVGWSRRSSRMIGRALVRTPGTPEFRVSEFDRCVSPWDEAAMSKIPRTPAAVEQLARAQVRWLRSLGPQVAGGGELIVCRVTKNAIELRRTLTFQAEKAAA